MVLERLDAERKSLHTLSAGLFAASPLPWFLINKLSADGALPTFRWTHMVGIASSFLLLILAVLLAHGQTMIRLLSSLMVIATLTLAAFSLEFSPPIVLLALVAGALTLSSLWTAAPGSSDPFVRRALRARGSALVATGIAPFIFWQHRDDAGLVMSLTFLLCAPLQVSWLSHLEWRAARWRTIALAVVMALAISGCAAWQMWPQALGLLGLVSLTAYLVNPGANPGMAGESGFLDLILGHPGRLTVATFVVLCGGGAFLLAMPWSLEQGQDLAPVDALFTAVSAACVTGLTVVDTPVTFSFAGEFILMLLIQLGGLGIMTFSTTAMRLLGLRMNLRTEGSVAGLLSPSDRSALHSAARSILILTFTAEGVGAAVLFQRFLAHGETIAAALWKAIFTSVSAYCNAGFALNSDNLVAFQGDFIVLHTVALLIITGGISPVIAVLIPAWLRRRFRGSLDAQTQVVLTTTVVLLVAGFGGTLAMEWSNTLSGLTFWEKLNNSWFHSVSTRTAGFNAISMENLAPATQLLTIGLMFVGGSPGGTAGGIKTTTAAVLFAVCLAALKGRSDAKFFRRRISQRTIFRALAVTAVGGLVVSTAVTLLLMTQSIPMPIALFEVVSALGTVGLTVGGTPMLDGVGKVIIICCMFAGRVGPLSLFMLLNRDVPKLTWLRPETDFELG